MPRQTKLDSNNLLSYPNSDNQFNREIVNPCICNGLSHDVSMLIFSFLDWNHLLNTVQVNRAWKALSWKYNFNVLGPKIGLMYKLKNSLKQTFPSLFINQNNFSANIEGNYSKEKGTLIEYMSLAIKAEKTISRIFQQLNSNDLKNDQLPVKVFLNADPTSQFSKEMLEKLKIYSEIKDYRLKGQPIGYDLIDKLSKVESSNQFGDYCLEYFSFSTLVTICEKFISQGRLENAFKLALKMQNSRKILGDLDVGEILRNIYQRFLNQGKIEEVINLIEMTHQQLTLESPQDNSVKNKNFAWLILIKTMILENKLITSLEMIKSRNILNKIIRYPVYHALGTKLLENHSQYSNIQTMDSIFIPLAKESLEGSLHAFLHSDSICWNELIALIGMISEKERSRIAFEMMMSCLKKDKNAIIPAEKLVKCIIDKELQQIAKTIVDLYDNGFI